jgi:hypothetical protein
MHCCLSETLCAEARQVCSSRLHWMPHVSQLLTHALGFELKNELNWFFARLSFQ